MKRFQFTQARLLDLRRQQLELEQAKLEALNAERQALEAESRRVESEATETRRQLMVTDSIEARELAVSDRYLRRLSAESTRNMANLADWRMRAAKQEQIILEARRRVRLLEKLLERELGNWKAAVDREQENLSSELYLARWKQ